MSLSEMVRRRYPQYREELDALRDCQWRGFKAGGIGLVGGAGVLYAATTLYAKRFNLLLLHSVPAITGVGACLCAGAASMLASGQCMRGLPAKYERIRQEKEERQSEAAVQEAQNNESAQSFQMDESPSQSFDRYDKMTDDGRRKW